MKYSGAEITIKLLEKCGVRTIAGVPGGSNLPLYDALYRSNIHHVLARHEQGAAFIAQGMARTTGEAAVCFATSGPGATNLLTAIADAKLDSVPLIAITGQVPYSMLGTDAFQEVDTYGLTIPITKQNFLVRSLHELFTVIPEAFEIARSGRPGPVLIDIPKDIQMTEWEFDLWPEVSSCIDDDHIPDLDIIKKAAEMINQSQKPVLYIGGGIINSQAGSVLEKLARKNNIPVATTLMGIGGFDSEIPLYLGMLGMHAARYTNLVLGEADLLLALGVRFDDRAIGNASKFCPTAKIIHIDIDESEINKIRRADLAIPGDIRGILTKILPLVQKNERFKWMREVENKKREFPFQLPDQEDVFHPINIISEVGKIAKHNTIITTDVGQHQMWTAQAYPFKIPRTFITSGGLGTMGFGLPAAIGAAIANPDRKVICFTGDGSFLMNIQELATLADLELDVTIIILNNGYLGMVRQQQEMFYKKQYIASKFARNPDFTIISKGFGIESSNLPDEGTLEELKEIINRKGPYVINVLIGSYENVIPIVPPGKGIFEMI